MRLRFFVQDEAERLAETVRATFSLETLPDTFLLDETDFVHGLPKVLQYSMNVHKLTYEPCHTFCHFLKSSFSYRWCFASSICQSRWWQNPQDRPTSTAGIRKINRSLYQKYDKKQINFDVKLNLGLIVISFSAQNSQRFSTSSLLSLSWPGTNFSQ